MSGTTAGFAEPEPWLRSRLFEGLVIPAHPLVLTEDGEFDEPGQCDLTRYYLEAGAGGIAVGVHTTQFEIRSPEHGLLDPVLELAATTVRAFDQASTRSGRPPTVLIAGVCGRTEQAISEAKLASGLGYHAGLLSLAALPDSSDDELIEHCKAVAVEIPLFGFYLQPAVGGRFLSRDFWRRFAALPNVVGIKVAPFDRYQTLDVVRAVAEAGREKEVALYTGNDDHIVMDLVTTYEIGTDRGPVRLGMVGGLLGQWAVWTGGAVRILEQCKQARKTGVVTASLLTLAEQLTEANAVIFDVDNQFAGCIPGIHEVLRRQGLMPSLRCLRPDEVLSRDQGEHLDRIIQHYGKSLGDQ
jgi:dihydrodipicolinate synthase/N-acetylneuraminate lyase